MPLFCHLRVGVGISRVMVVDDVLVGVIRSIPPRALICVHGDGSLS